MDMCKSERQEPLSTTAPAPCPTTHREAGIHRSPYPNGAPPFPTCPPHAEARISTLPAPIPSSLRNVFPPAAKLKRACIALRTIRERRSCFLFPSLFRHCRSFRTDHFPPRHSAKRSQPRQDCIPQASDPPHVPHISLKQRRKAPRRHVLFRTNKTQTTLPEHVLPCSSREDTTKFSASSCFHPLRSFFPFIIVCFLKAPVPSHNICACYVRSRRFSARSYRKFSICPSFVRE